MILSKQFRFEASHRLPYHQGKCRRLHGHSWVLEVEVEGKVDPSTGFVVDYGDIKAAVQPIVDDLDHKHLGTWEGLGALGASNNVLMESLVSWLPPTFNCTSENLLIMIAHRLESLLWSRLTLHETCTSAATLTREEYEASYR